MQVQARVMPSSSSCNRVANSFGQRSDIKSGYGQRRIRLHEDLKLLPTGRAQRFLTSACGSLSDVNLSRNWNNNKRKRRSANGRSRNRRGETLNSNSIATRSSYNSGEDWPVMEDRFTHVVIGSGIAGMTCAVKVPGGML